MLRIEGANLINRSAQERLIHAGRWAEHLLPLYSPAQAGDVIRVLEEFSQSEAGLVQQVVDREQRSNLDRSVFVLQPEMLLIYERLKHDIYALRQRWSTRYPDEELERFAIAFGIAI